MFEFHVSIREIVGVAVAIVGNHFRGGLRAGGVDDELGKVGTTYLWGVGGLETRGGAAFEDRHGNRTFVFPEDIGQRVGHLARFLQACACRREDLYGELVAVGERHITLWNILKEKSTQYDAGNTYGHRSIRMTEA